MQNRLKWLDVPTLYQGNANNSDSKVWCGRTSASMVWNYYQRARGKGDQLIVNQASKSPYELVRPDGTIACTLAGQSGRYYLYDQVAVTGKGWKNGPIFPQKDRPASVSKAKMLEILEPLISGLDRNNPAVIYTSISGNETLPRHIIVLSGYRVDDRGELWLLIDDPFKRKVDLLGASNFDTIGPPDGPELRDGGAEAKGARYWLRAMRLFEENTHSTRAGDLFCDHCDSPGLYSIYNPTLETPPSPYSHTSSSRSVVFPFDGANDVDSPVRHLFRNETRAGGGFYPLGFFENIHGGVHLSPEAASGPLAAVRSLAPGHVVAARLTAALPSSLAAGDTAGGLSKSELSEELALAGNSFVLVRHVLEEVLPKGAEGEPKTFTFYTLSMHLEPPRWDDDASAKLHAKVPWLDALLRRRNGSVVVIDPGVSTFGKQWLPAAAQDGKTRGGGPLAVFGETFKETVTIDLGPAEDGRVLAICRPAEPGLQGALDALAGGAVVTCPEAAMPVGAGDPLGYIKSAATSFLHWEVLAPAGADGGLEAMLDFAAEKLKLGAGFFRRFEEKTENNLFDPDGEELATLLGMLPDDDADKAELLSPGYRGAQLARIFNAPGHMAFATGKPAGAAEQPGELAYPLRIALENFRGAVPAGTYALQMSFEPDSFPKRTVTFDIAAKHVDVMVPAGAKKILLESTNFFIELDPRRSTPEEDAAHFKHLAAARLRDVVLQHLNEWSKDGLVAAMKPRFEDPDKDLETPAKAVAFWANEEKALLQEDGKEKKLFSASAGPNELPEETKLAQAHPVMTGWLAGLLVDHRIARFRDRFPPPGKPDSAKKLLFLGWMPDYTPARPRAVGEPLHAVAVAAGEVDGGDELVLQARGPGAPGPVVLGRRTYERGLARVSLPCPFWGDWALEVPSQSAEIAHVDLNGLTPELGDLSAPVRDKKTGSYTWTIHFSKNRPSRIAGLVVFERWKTKAGEQPTGPGMPAKIAVPLCAEPLPPDPKDTRKLDPTRQLIVGAKAKTKVTGSFYIEEYTQVFEGSAGDFRLAVSLSEKIEAVRNGYATLMKNAKLGVTVVSLAADGLSARIACSSHTVERHNALVSAAKKQGFTVLEELDKQIRVGVSPPPPGVAGPVVGVFDPAAAWNALLDEAAPGADEQVHVRFGVFFPNGGTLVLPPGANGPSTGVVQADLLALRATCPGALEAFTAAPSATLRKPQFAPVAAKIDGEGLVLSAALCGADADWSAAKPAFFFKDKGGAERTFGKKVGTSLVGTILLSDARVAGRKVTFEARVTKEGALFDGVKLAVPPVSIEIDTTPALGEAPSLEWTATDLVITGKTRSFPTSKALEIAVRKITAEGEKETALGKSARFNSAYKTYQGFADGAGNVVVRIGRSVLAKELSPGDSFKVELFRPKSYGAVLGQTIEPVTAEGTVPET